MRLFSCPKGKKMSGRCQGNEIGRTIETAFAFWKKQEGILKHPHEDGAPMNEEEIDDILWKERWNDGRDGWKLNY
jgi:hypothetical protein